MTDLGELGRPREAEEVTFGYFGERIRTNPGLTDLGILRMVRRLGNLDEVEKLDEALALVDGLVASLIHADDVDLFWRTAEANRQEIDDLTDTVGQIVEGITARPTRRPSVSSGGPRTTSPSSGDGYSSVVIDRYVKSGRPDLALGVVRSVADHSA